MSYTELNVAFIEHFGDLERLCNQIYHTHHGVNNYIDDMQSKISLGIRYILGWENSLKKLKEVRYKRNQLSHGEVPFMASWATNEDITFVCNLRHSILCGQDPLALLRKEMEGAQTPKPSFSQSPNIISSPPISVITPASVSATPNPKKRAPSIGIIALLALACASFLLFLIVIIYLSFI